MRLIFTVILSICLLPAYAANDTTLYLSKDELVSIVRQYHPVVRQADVLVNRYKANVLESRGGFDPKFTSGLDRKTFDGKLYYSYFNPEIKIPTWFGIDIKGGLEEVVGERVTQESTFGKSSYIGATVPVTRGLFFDERRATLRQAQAMSNMSEAERLLMINNVLFEAVSTYWEWVREYSFYKIYSTAVDLNIDRLNMVKSEYVQGNRPAIDTVEALTQLQTYQLLQNEAYLNFQNSGLELSNYLWLDNNQPMEWVSVLVPDTFSFTADMYDTYNIPVLEDLVAQASINHPKLQMVNFKIDALKIERKLKAVSILPKLDVNANILSKDYGLPNDLSTPFLENNYKLGVDFSMPLFFRKEIGAYRASRFKVQEADIERDYTSLKIENKIKSYYNEVVMLNKQILLYEDAQKNYSRMLRGEMIRYEIGESNLFLINSRENKLLNAQQKLMELKTKWHKSYAGLLWAAGVI